ncbi:GH23293 [Drosophila grimshawi]|uniref:GH23293 n=1 Tax=Drosophila grimshawi TaxID=7222 RepID=B4K3K5_DROGR|nr:GH23293 [Drosophila grimshawi]
MESEKRTINELLDVQEDISDEIVRLISNYEKDSAERKSLAGYHKIKADSLNEGWNIVQENDEVIRKSGELPKNHEYFNYYEDIRTTVLKYLEVIKNDAETISKNLEIGDGEHQQSTLEPKVIALCRRQKSHIAPKHPY